MRICSPKNFLIMFMMIFLFFNTLYFFHYLLIQEYSKEEKIDKQSQISFLKNYVDFNHTAFLNKGKVHFYYPAYIKFPVENDISDIPSGDKIIPIIFNKDCNFTYDSKLKLYIDSQNQLCDFKNFIYNKGCCENETISESKDYLNLENKLSIFSQHCDEISKCCLYKSLCIKSCIENLRKKNDIADLFSKCKSKCELDLFSIQTIYKYCYSDLENTSNHTKLIISK
jgi:hypothetical protein